MATPSWAAIVWIMLLAFWVLCAAAGCVSAVTVTAPAATAIATSNNTAPIRCVHVFFVILFPPLLYRIPWRAQQQPGYNLCVSQNRKRKNAPRRPPSTRLTVEKGKILHFIHENFKLFPIFNECACFYFSRRLLFTQCLAAEENQTEGCSGEAGCSFAKGASRGSLAARLLFFKQARPFSLTRPAPRPILVVHAAASGRGKKGNLHHRSVGNTPQTA